MNVNELFQKKYLQTNEGGGGGGGGGVCVCVCVRGGGWMAWGGEGNGNVGLATFLKKIPGIFRFATLPSKNSGQNKLSISFTSTSAVVTASNELSNIYN